MTNKRKIIILLFEETPHKFITEKEKLFTTILRLIDRVFGINATQHNFRIFLTCHVTSCWSKNSNRNMELFQPPCRE
jgi:hypothetical protein